MGVLIDALEQARRADDPYLDALSATEESLGDGVDLSYFELHGLELTRCSLAGARLGKTSFYDCTLTECDLSNANLTEAFLTRTRLVRCKLNGAVLTHAFLRTCRLVECVCRYVNLGEAKLENVRLEGCDLREAFLNELRFRRGTRLEGCDLTRADLFRTSLKGLDLSTCEIAGITVSDTRAELRGALISAEQAVDVAAMLGVRIVG